MLKDRDLIQEVIKEMKIDKTERNFRVFKAMRLMRREYMRMVLNDNSTEDGISEDGIEIGARSGTMASEAIMLPKANLKRLKDITVKNILSNFRKLGRINEDMEIDEDTLRRMSYRYSSIEDGAYAVGIEDIHQLVRMCGGDLNKFESFYLLKRSNYDGASLDSTRDVTCHEFTDAVESYVNDATAEP